jgi:hypothetical protein
MSSSTRPYTSPKAKKSFCNFMVVASFQKSKRRKSSFTTALAWLPAVSLSRDAKKHCPIVKPPFFPLSL